MSLHNHYYISSNENRWRKPCSLLATKMLLQLRTQRVLVGLSRGTQSLQTNHFVSRIFTSGPNVQKYSTTCDAAKIASCQEAHDLINKGGESGYKYLDVRTPEEYSAGHVNGSVNIPVWLRDQATGQMAANPGFVDTVETQFPNKDTKLCLGCLSGKRSEQAAAMLTDAGYSDLVNMSEGYQGWCAAGLPTTS
jgi:rhodanese-related sulfurtransferase